MIEQDLISQMDTAVFSSIAIASQQTANNTTLGYYDYWTIIISILAFVVALASFWIAKETLSSQRKTERNTRTISLECQVKMLNELFKKAYTNFIRIAVLKRKWAKSKYRGFPYDDIVCRMKLTLQYLHLESCSSLSENQYVKLLRLSQLLDEYNERLSVRFNNFRNKEISEEIKKMGLDSIERELALLIKVIVDAKREIEGNADADFYAKCISEIAVVERDMRGDSKLSQSHEDIDVPESVKLLDIFPQPELLKLEDSVKRCIGAYLGTDKRGVEYVKIIEA